MKSCALLACLILFGATAARAQVTVEMVADERYFLPGETMQVGIRIKNDSGRTLDLNSILNSIDLIVQSGERDVQTKQVDLSLPEEHFLENGQMATRRFNLDPHFSLARPGHYTTGATVRIPELGQSYTAKSTTIDVLPGFEIWSRVVGVPLEDPQDPGPLRVRKYSLIKTPRGDRNYLYAKVTDESGSLIYGVRQLTVMLSISQPEQLLDSKNNLHVLCQNERVEFNYTVLDPNGEILKRETWVNIGRGKPGLRLNLDGEAEVTAAQRRVTSDDFPPPAQETVTQN